MARSNKDTPFWSTGIAAIAIISALFLGLGSTSIYIVDESRNAQAGWEMLQSGDYIVPHFNHGLRGDKPPLHYWFMTIAYAIGGKTAFAARFFSAFVGLLLIAGLYQFSRRYHRSEVSFWLVLCCASAVYLPLQLKLATPDPYLIAFFGLGMLALWHGWQQQHLGYLLAGYLFIGLASLAKGPIAPAMAGLSMVIFLLWDGKLKWTYIRQFRPFLGALIFLAVALPWYLLVHAKTDGIFTQAFFVEHNIDRFSSTKEGHGGGVWVVPLLMLVSLLPFSVFLPQGIRYFRKEGKSHDRLAASIVIAFLVFFTISRTKLPSYPAPAYPFLALFLAPALAQMAKEEQRLYTWQLLLLLMISLGLPIGAYFGLASIPEGAHLQGQAVWLVPCSLAVLLAGWYHLQQQPRRVLYAIATAFWLLQIILLGYLLPQLDRQNHVQQSLALLQAREQPIIAYHKFSPAYVFNHRAPVHFARTAADYDLLIQKFGDQCPLVLTVDDRKNDIDCDPRLQFLFKQKDLFERPVTTIYRYEKESCP